MKLYENISEQVKRSSISYSILRLDNSISIEDLIQDVYLKVYNKGNENYLNRQIKQSLIDIYRKKSNNLQTCIYDEDVASDYINDTEMNTIIKESLGILNGIDTILQKLIHGYFLEKMTYKELSIKYNIPLATIKRKIDKAIDILKEYYNK